MGQHEQALMMDGAPHHQEKMQAGDLLNNLDHQSASGAHDEKNPSQRDGNKCLCCLSVLSTGMRTCLLMSLFVAFLLAAGLVALWTLKIHELDTDGCSAWLHHSSLNLRPSHYRLFATKTSYNAALSQLIPGHLTHTPTNHQTPITHPFDSTYTSTQQLHRHLTTQQGCTLKQLHFFGRHAARYPSSQETQNLTLLMAQVQSLIDLKNFSLPPALLNQLNDTSGLSHGTGNATAKLCFNPLAQYKQWRNFMDPLQANQLMHSGALETQAMARRYQSLYPNLFHAAKRKPKLLQVGVTSEPRTAQTAINFVAALDPSNETLAQLNLDQCDDPSLISRQIETAEQVKLEQLYQSECFKKFSQTHFMERLQFHKLCEKHYRDQHIVSNHLNLTTEPWLSSIADSVAKKLKLNNVDNNQDQSKQEPPLSHDQVKAIYKTCKYEAALNAHRGAESIWCNLFTESQLQFLEYLEDLQDYFLQGYGHSSLAKSACVVTADIFRAIRMFRRTQQEDIRLYFTHSHVIQRLIAAAVDLDSDDGYRSTVMQDNVRLGRAPESVRNWRTSLMTPFSANLAFTFYECPATDTRPPQNQADNYLELEVASPYKLVASLNERPILMDGCSQVDCDLDQFLSHARFNIDSRCQLEEICTKRVVID